MAIKVTTQPSGDREVTLKGSLDDFLELHGATCQGRRTRKEAACLENFGNALIAADADLFAAVTAAQAAAKVATKTEDDA
jgi:hypothetical protein